MTIFSSTRLIKSRQVLLPLSTVAVLSLLFFYSASNAFAGNSISVVRGQQPLLVGWQVAGGYENFPTCAPTTDIPTQSIRIAWMTGGGSLYGNVSLPKPTDVGAFSFTCTHASGAYDIASLTVTDCTAGLEWDPGTSTCVQTKPDLTVTPNPPGTVSPNTATVGVSTPFNLEIKNQGGATTGSSFTNVLKKANDASGNGVVFVATNGAGPLATNAQTSGFIIPYTPVSGDVGTKYFQICADQNLSGTGSIDEGSNEGNNCGDWTQVAVFPPITGTCSVSPDTGTTNDPFTWIVNSISGGTGTYTYSWSGTDGLSGTGVSVVKQYPTAGVKTGSVTVSSGGSSQTFSCTNSVGGTSITVVSGSLTLNPTASCVVAQNASTCTVSASWTTSNATGVYLLDRNVNEIKHTANSFAYPPGFTVNVWGGPGGTIFDLKNGNGAILDTKTASASCASETTWNTSSGKCVSSQINGTIDASPNPCPVPVGGNTCTTNLTWSISNNTPNPNVYSLDTNTNLSTDYSGSNLPATITFNGSTFLNGSQFSVRNSSSILNSRLVTGTCVSGSWNGTTCSPPVSPTLTCSRSPSGSPITAPAIVTYTAVALGDAAAPYVFRDALNNTLQSDSSLTFQKTYSAGQGDSVTVSASNAPSVSCGGAFTVVGAGSCSSNPAGSIIASPSRVRAGSATPLSWNATGVQTSCTVTGPGITTPITTLKDVTCGVTGSASSPIINTQSIYTLTCDGIPVDRVTVNIGPTFEEF